MLSSFTANIPADPRPERSNASGVTGEVLPVTFSEIWFKNIYILLRGQSRFSSKLKVQKERLQLLKPTCTGWYRWLCLYFRGPAIVWGPSLVFTDPNEVCEDERGVAVVKMAVEMRLFRKQRADTYHVRAEQTLTGACCNNEDVCVRLI